MNLADGWEPIKSQGRLVYYRRQLTDRSWLGVKKTGTSWMWAHHDPKRVVGGYRFYGCVVASGTRSTSRLAMAAADQHLDATAVQQRTTP